MKTLLRIVLGLCLCGALPPSSFAQCIIDPQDRLYQLITVWEEKGYVSRLPLLRPYPINLTEKILATVIAKGDPVEVAIAQDYLDRLKTERDRTAPDKLLPSPFGLKLGNSFWTTFDELIYDLRPTITVQGAFFEIFSFSGFATMGFQLGNGDPAPFYTRISDEGKSGGGAALVGGMSFDGRNLGLGAIFLGTEDLYMQAGIMRSSFGPFYDHGIILGPHCPGAGHISFTWNTGWLTVTSILLIVNPLYVENEDSGLKTLTSSYNTDPSHTHTLSYEKYVALHTFTFYPFDWWNFGIIEAVVFGGRFNPAYLFPLQHMPYTQLLFGDQDSSYLGIFNRFTLPGNFRLDVMFYLDDFNFNKFVGGEGTLFDLNSGQNKFALQAGLTWTPRIERLRRISFDYTMITPFTFTHNSTAVVNYLNYTHDDSGIGSILQPNSDQLYLSIFMQPASFLCLDFFSRFIRHGDPSEGYAGAGMGDYWDDGRDNTGTVYFFGPMQFLTQSILEKIFQVGLSAEFRIKLGFGVLMLGAGYTFEYGWDRNLVSGNDGARHYINLKMGIDL